MTVRHITQGLSNAKVLRFPDPPPEEMTAFHQVGFPAYPASLALHFQDEATTIITSEVAAGVRPTESYEGILFPDLLIAFNVNAEASIARNGYLIPEQGKPPDFVMEVASRTTARRDETDQARRLSAAMRIPEYWRFDTTGGEWYQAPLAGDRLVAGKYEPIPIHRTPQGHYWGHSDALNLDLCWEDGNLRFWDPESMTYPSTAPPHLPRTAGQPPHRRVAGQLRRKPGQLRRKPGRSRRSRGAPAARRTATPPLPIVPLIGTR